MEAWEPAYVVASSNLLQVHKRDEPVLLIDRFLIVNLLNINIDVFRTLSIMYV